MTIEQSENEIGVGECVSGDSSSCVGGVDHNAPTEEGSSETTIADKKVAADQQPTSTEADEDESNTSGTDDDEDDDDDDDGLTAEELTVIGLDAMKGAEADVDFAVNKFSMALEKKLQELDDELHPSLGTYYLNYGNALQVKEEQSSELFAFTRNSEGKVTGVDEKQTFSVSLGGEGDKVREDITDEQLAWENLDLARVVLTRALQSVVNDGIPEDVPNNEVEKRGGLKQIVEDLSFAHIRLGDIHMLAERFGEAMEEFEVAAGLREKYELPYTAMESVVISLAQAQLFSVKPEAALRSFNRAKKLIEDHLRGVGGHVLPDNSSRRKDYEMTLEDLNVQIAEISKGIEDGLYKQQPKSEPSSSSSGNAKPSTSGRADALRVACVSKDSADDSGTTTGFSRPMLPDATVVDLGVVSTKSKIQQEVVSPKSDKKENSGAIQTGEGEGECEKRSKRRRIVPRTMEG